MKAVCYRRYGGPDVLAVEELDAPVAADDQVLIRVRAAEVTKSDTELRSFRYPVSQFWLPLRLGWGVWRPRRPVLGGYFSGEIAAVGKAVSGFVEGHEVFGCAGLRMGAYGEFMILPGTCTLERKPSNMTFEQAAALPLGGLNALHFLRRAPIESGTRVLVNGAGGSIGAYGVQIARAMGATVTAVDDAVKEPLIRRLGADQFIDYTQQHFADLDQTWDVVFDMVAGSSYRDCLRVLRPDGVYLKGNPRLTDMLRAPFTTRFSGKTSLFAFAGETREELAALRDMIERGEIVSIVEHVLSMDDAAQAHCLVETAQRAGAVVMVIGTGSD